MVVEQQEGFSFKYLFLASLISAIIIIILFTAIDYLVHQIDIFKVPFIYFINKLWIGTLLLTFFSIVTIFLRKMPVVRAFINSLLITLLLQIRYFYSYELLFNILIPLTHFIELFILLFIYYNFVESSVVN